MRNPLLVVLVLLGTVGSAAAQDGATSEASPAEALPAETSPAETLPAEAAPDPATAEAMERYADAVALFERSDFRGALVEMQRVLELLEGRENQYIVLYDLGRVYEELHRYDLAAATYRRYLAESPEDAPDRPEADASLRALDRLVGTVSIEVDVAAADVWIGDWQVGTAPGDILIPAGVHVLELRAAGHETVRRQIEVSARTTLDVTVSLPLLSDFHGVDPALFWASTITAVLAAGAGAALGGVALSLSSDSAACTTRIGCELADPAGRRREISDFALGADVLFGAAGLFAITSIVLAFLTDWSGRPASASPEASARRLVPQIVPQVGDRSGGVTASFEF